MISRSPFALVLALVPLLGALLLSLATARAAPPRPAAAAGVHEARAMEVMAAIQQDFYDRKSSLYSAKRGKPEPDLIWGNGVMFSALVGAARHDKDYRPVMRKYYDALEAYWDLKAPIPGYEPARTQGGHDKYYDDNAWMVLTFLEAYDLTGESRYQRRAGETLKFVLSGWDDQGGGGIWWHEQHKGGGKNTCSNAPAALGCFRLARLRDPRSAAPLIDQGEKLVSWTVTNFQDSDGLFKDSKNLQTGQVNGAKLTYNSALMLRSFLAQHARTGKPAPLAEAVRIGKSADSLLDSKTGAYRDPIKWAHLMVEADLELYRWTHDERYLKRAVKNGEVHYAAWKNAPADDLITVASLARELWLLADTETAAGQAFWKASDRPRQ